MRLLTIDNNDRFAGCYLEGFWRAGYECDRAGDLTKGEWLLRKNNYDLVIVEGHKVGEARLFVEKVVLKVFKGFLLLIFDEIRPDEKLYFYDLGVDEILSAPVSFREILAKTRIINSWEKKVHFADSCFRLADLVVDLNRFKVYRAGREIKLRKKEFDLLQYLIVNRGIVLNKIVILEAVWDLNYEGSVNTLEVHMLGLRRKIDGNRPAEQRLIHTVHGRGYSFGVYAGRTTPRFLPKTPFYPKKQILAPLLPEPAAY